MSRAGATCPCCNDAIMTMEDIRLEGRAGRLAAVMTAVVVDGSEGQGIPTCPRITSGRWRKWTEERLQALYADIPFGLPEEPLPSKEALGFRVPLYGFDTHGGSCSRIGSYWPLAEFVRALNRMPKQLADYPPEWTESLVAMCLPIISRMADRGSTLATWTNNPEKIRSTFARFALPITWDFSEFAPLSDTTGGFVQSVDWVFKACEASARRALIQPEVERAFVHRQSPAQPSSVDLILTDPPYYDAIPYSDLMDFFYVWLRRSIPEIVRRSRVRSSPMPSVPKWDHDIRRRRAHRRRQSDLAETDERSKQNYEDGMARSFRSCHAALRTDGRFVVVFANKQPDAWETLVAALIRAGFVVDGSWPIQTEMGNRNRAIASAALSSSVWIVCRKRAEARPGWDNTVLSEMRENIALRLRDFWDAGIRGPDFVWAATGPALEAFSKHPVVKKANDPNQFMTVSAFLREVRRMVVDFVVGRVLIQDGLPAQAGGREAATGLDDVTTYYLLHRHDFGMDDAPIGGCILYALSCNLSDCGPGEPARPPGPIGQGERRRRDSKRMTGQTTRPMKWMKPVAEEAPGSSSNPGTDAGAATSASKRRADAPVPLIDQVHKLLHLWRAGDQVKVNDYLDSRGLPRNALFNQLLQALIELASAGSEERSLLEALSNHVAARGDVQAPRQGRLQLGPAAS